MNTSLSDQLHRKPQFAWIDQASLGTDNTPGAGSATLFTITPESPGIVELYISLQNVLNSHSGSMYIETQVDSLNWVRIAEMSMITGVVTVVWGFEGSVVTAIDLSALDYALYKRFYTDPVLEWRLGYTRTAGAAIRG